jgi:signal transduction protein with GAF and PtsI domain
LGIQVKAFLKVRADKDSFHLILPHVLTVREVDAFKQKVAEFNQGELPPIGIAIDSARACSLAYQFAKGADFPFVDLDQFHSNVYSI